MRNDFFKDYVGQYSISKTLRFELRPQGRTQEYIEKNGIITEDEDRARDYAKVKKVIDEYHKKFMEKALKKLELDQLELKDYYEHVLARDRSKQDTWEMEKQTKEIEKLEESLRKQVVKCLKEDKKYDLLFKSQLITEELLQFAEDDESKDAIRNFQRFTTYFQGFFENRKNMYSSEAKSTAVAYRIVNQNLPRFIDNMRVFKTIMETELIDSVADVQRQMGEIIGERCLEVFFQLPNYTHTVTNSDIEVYNTLIGGRVLPDGTKLKGINEYVNEYNQKNGKDRATHSKLPKLKPLYKQILADRESLSFAEEQFTDDQQLLDTVNTVVTDIYERILKRESRSSLQTLLENISNYDLDGIFVTNGPAITNISNAVYGDWSVLKSCLKKEYDALSGKKVRNEKYYDERNRKIKQQRSFSLGRLNRIAQEYGGCEEHLESFFSSLGEKEGVNLLDIFEDARDKVELLFHTTYASKHGLASDKKSVALLKQLLDSLKDIENFVKPLLGTGTESEKDDRFYGELDAIYSELARITPLYNKVRNYVTRKPYSVEKVKINFQNPTLLNGWDVNKERDNLAVILRKDGLYYLGIMNKKYNKAFLENVPMPEGKSFEKMEYKLLPGPNKMLPKVFFGKSNLDIFQPSEEILRNYERGSHKLGDTFNLKECHQLIDFFKSSIEKHDDWCRFDFQFTNTNEYRDISQFYHEVEKQGYSVNFRRIPVTYIDQLVDSGKLYLFQIYNKDFSHYAKGTPNLHTLYWHMLFDERNLENVVYKLNGEAEIFYRKASINEDNMVIHPQGKRIAKKNAKAQAQQETSTFTYDLIKDRRYTMDKYQFHVPITINFCAEGKSNINNLVLDKIRRDHDVNVIGIDRGERNLLYISVVSPEGKVLHQQSLNVIENDKGYSQDYHALLDTKEKKMDQARREWTEIESIKELKEGYLSQAIHIITDLMIQYNAIVVLEDLNFGFMNGRKKVGKQVYQKFEKMLIDKLNYLVDKKADPCELGGALQAYQLTNRFESFSKIGKQCGFLFYIPAWNTSKIDPTTGFVNFLHPKYTSITEARDFIRRFDSIRYNCQEGYFEFSVDYKKFPDRACGSRLEWVLCSYGDRIRTFRNPERNNEWDSQQIDMTARLCEHFKQYGIQIVEGDLTEAICQVDQAQFYRDILEDIRLVVQMRNSIPNTDIDYMISPIKNAKGEFFDTRKYCEEDVYFNYFPKDADANGAYNIARKGLMAMKKIRQEEGRVNLAISNQEWLEFAQTNTL